MLPKIKPSKKRIYLDYAATTPIHPLVKRAMDPFLSVYFGNPSSLYKEGREAALALEESRQKIADVLNARPQEVYFTAGGTESVNTATFGVARNFKKGHIITSAIEHHAVLRSCEALQKEGFEVTFLPVDEQGFVNVKDVIASVKPETILISVMYANNEIGTIEPIAEISKTVRQINIERTKKGFAHILFHTDACQAAGFLDMNVNHLGVDLLSLNGSKIYGPKQTGILYIRSGIKIHPLIYGGGQERNARSGTENVAGAVGLSLALELSQKEKNKETKKLLPLRDYFIKRLTKIISNALVNGPVGEKRLVNNVNISIPGIEGEALLLYLDSYHIAVSTGSACASTSTDPSHVLLAIGRSRELALGSVRFTFGKFTTKQELGYALKVLPGLVEELKKVAR